MKYIYFADTNCCWSSDRNVFNKGVPIRRYIISKFRFKKNDYFLQMYHHGNKMLSSLENIRVEIIKSFSLVEFYEKI